MGMLMERHVILCKSQKLQSDMVPSESFVCLVVVVVFVSFDVEMMQGVSENMVACWSLL